MRAALPSLLFALSACATTAEVTPDSPPQTSAALELGPQTLAPNECGLFGWDNRSRFTFFATQDRGLFAADREIMELVPEGEFPALSFGEVELELGRGEPLDAGQRYRYARLSQVLDDGFTRVLPLVVIEACQVPTAPL